MNNTYNQENIKVSVKLTNNLYRYTYTCFWQIILLLFKYRKRVKNRDGQDMNRHHSGHFWVTRPDWTANIRKRSNISFRTFSKVPTATRLMAMKQSTLEHACLVNVTRGHTDYSWISISFTIILKSVIIINHAYFYYKKRCSVYRHQK